MESIEFGDGLVGDRVAGVERGGGFHHQHDGFVGERAGTVLGAAGHDQEFALVEFDGSVAKVDGDPALEHEKGFVLGLMGMPVEDVAELGELDLGVVDIPGDVRLPDALDLLGGSADEVELAGSHQSVSAAVGVMMVNWMTKVFSVQWARSSDWPASPVPLRLAKLPSD